MKIDIVLPRFEMERSGKEGYAQEDQTSKHPSSGGKVITYSTCVAVTRNNLLTLLLTAYTYQLSYYFQPLSEKA